MHRFSLAAFLLFACQSQVAEPALPLTAVVDAAPDVSPNVPEHSEPDMPGVVADPAFTLRLRAELAKRSKDYVARTEHKDKAGVPTYVNRLIKESSPYLIQHAHNPVNWYPWGEEAFAAAAKLNRPILLSVGYSTCHWCHVMERESFEDIEIATFINANFIPIKVDREERPDVDDIYMNAVRMLSRGNGGWPMTVVMTPKREPFFGGTYFPARTGDRGSRKGFFTILQELSASYHQDNAGVVAEAARITDRIRQQSAGQRPGDVPGPDAIEKAAHGFARTFDAQWGGFGRQPKFPRPASLDFLLRYYERTRDAHALTIVTTTLDKMADGGMYDHLGGGFHRYSTDRKWLAPHFEKMLYDNGQLASTYTAAFQVTGNPKYATVVRETLDYVIREMTAPEGPFFSATDADSAKPDGEQEEGWFFVWTPNEVKAVVGAERARLVAAYYDVTPQGNFEGRNILHTEEPLETVAASLKMAPEALKAELAAAKKAMYAARLKRPPPLLDDKILTAWNGLMISGMAHGGLVLDEPRYVQAAEKAAGFILEKMRRKDGRLLRTYGSGRAKLNGYLDDYAFFIQGLLDLYEATGNLRWFMAAQGLQKLQDKHYADRDRGGYFTTSDDHEALLTRDKPTYDGALPAGNSVSVGNLLRFAEYTSDDAYRKVAERTLAAVGSGLKRGGTGQPRLLSALDMYLDVPKQVVLVAQALGDNNAHKSVLRARYLPNRVYAWLLDGAVEEQATVIPLVEGKRAQHPTGTAYVCEKGKCERPTGDPKVLAQQLGRSRPLYEDRKPAPLTSAAAPKDPKAWEYDKAGDRHWHEGHGHWHPGKPPAPGKR